MPLPPDQETLEAIFFPMWTNELQWGNEQSQSTAMMALRSHGWEVWAEGYWEEFQWKYRPPGKHCWCIVDPEVKPKNIFAGDEETSFT